MCGLFRFLTTNKKGDHIMITLPIAELKPALVGLGKIISKSPTLPVLGMVRVDRTKDGWVTLTGTDLDAFVTVRMEEPTSGDPESVLVPFNNLAKTTKSCSANESIQIEPGTENAVLVRYPVGQQFAENKIESLPVDEYPQVPKIKGEPVSLDSNIRTALLQAMECASLDETRYILRGAYIDVSDRKCHSVVGTDGRHLYTSNSFSLALADSIIIPSNKFLGWKEFNNDGEWQIRVGPGTEGHFQISSRRWRFIHKQIEGNYPNWRQVVPKDSSTTVQVSEEAAAVMANLIPRLPVNPKDINHTLKLKVERDKLMLLGRGSAEDKWTEAEVPGVKATGKPVTICLNREFVLKALKFGLTELHIQDELSAMRFVSGGKQMVVMPVRPDPTVPVKSPEPTPGPQTTPESSPVAAPEPTERNTMPKPSTGETTPAAEKSALETSIAQVEVVRGEFRNALAGLNKLAESLKAALREHKAGQKEVESVRQTLRSLQNVKI